MDHKPENLSKYFNKKIKKRRYKLKYKNLFGGALSDTFNIDPKHDYLYHGTSMFYFENIKEKGLTGWYPDDLYEKMQEVWGIMQQHITADKFSGGQFDDGGYIGGFFERQKKIRSPGTIRQDKIRSYGTISISFTRQKSVAMEYAGLGRTGGEGPGKFLDKLEEFINHQSKYQTINEKQKTLADDLYKRLLDTRYLPGMILFVEIDKIKHIYHDTPRELHLGHRDEVVIRREIPPEYIYVYIDGILRLINSSYATEYIEEEKRKTREITERVEEQRKEAEKQRGEAEKQRKTATWVESQKYTSNSPYTEITFEFRKHEKYIRVSYSWKIEPVIIISVQISSSIDLSNILQLYVIKITYNRANFIGSHIRNRGYIFHELKDDPEFMEKLITSLQKIIRDLRKRYISSELDKQFIVFLQHNISELFADIYFDYTHDISGVTNSDLKCIFMNKDIHLEKLDSIASKYICKKSNMNFSGCAPYHSQVFDKVFFCGDNICRSIISTVSQSSEETRRYMNTSIFFPSQFKFKSEDSDYLLSGDKDIRRGQYKYLLENLVMGIPLSQFLREQVTRLKSRISKIQAFISIYQFWRSADLGIDEENLRLALERIDLKSRFYISINIFDPPQIKSELYREYTNLYSQVDFYIEQTRIDFFLKDIKYL
jgi:hypothetical protein